MNDDELRELLRAADPARNLAHPRMLELTEAPMSANPSPARPNRTRLLVAAAAAAVVLAAGIGILIGDGDDEPAAQGPKPTPTRTLTTATYTIGAAPAGRCMVPDQNGIRDLDVAFRGKVVDRSDHRVLLIPSEYYTGDKVERVELDVQKAEGAIYELLPVDFQVGKEYVVAVKQDQVRLCGYTAEADPEMVSKYRSALGVR